MPASTSPLSACLSLCVRPYTGQIFLHFIANYLRLPSPRVIIEVLSMHGGGYAFDLRG